MSIQDEEVILSLNNFGAAFGEKIILNNLNLNIAYKKITTLLGPGGTGKSTLLRSITGLNDGNPAFKTWGDVKFSGENLSRENLPSIVTQSTRLVLKSVLENIIHNLPERNNLTQLQQKDLAVRLLEQANLSCLKGSLNENIVSLPLVLQRRIAILRLVSAGPRLLCLDEPTTGINDEDDIEQLLKHIHDESKRRAIIIVLHNQHQAKRLGGYAALLAGGQVKEFKEAKHFFAHPETEPAKQFIKSGSCSVPSPTAKPEELNEEVDAPVEINENTKKYVSESFGPRGFLWLYKGKLAGTPLPGVFFEQDYDLKALQRVGITHLISTTLKPVSTNNLNEFGIEGKAFPIEDMGTPTLDQAIEICRYIEKVIFSGGIVAVHCRAGLGRTGTVLALYLIWKNNDAISALEKVRSIEPRWVQSELQVKFLDEFSNYIHEKSSLQNCNDNNQNIDISNAI